MRTTVRLPDDLLRAAKRRAYQTGRTLTQRLEDSLRAELHEAAAPRRAASPSRCPRIADADFSRASS